MRRVAATLVVAGLLATAAPAGGHASARERLEKLGPGEPPGQPFKNCVEGFLGHQRGYWCFVEDLQVFVPFQ